MKQHFLILMRHATAGLVSDRDHSRPLTSEGLDEARRVGERFLKRQEAPDRIFASTALRCRQTRDALCAGLGREVETEFEDALYNASEAELLDAIAAQNTSGSLLVLAHNPGISILALGLCAHLRTAKSAPGTAEPRDGEAENERAKGLLRNQWIRMQGGFSPASTARFELRESWPELAPHTTRFLGFEEAPGN